LKPKLIIQKLIKLGYEHADSPSERIRIPIRNSLALGALIIVVFILISLAVFTTFVDVSETVLQLTIVSSSLFAIFCIYLLFLNYHGKVNLYLWSVSLFNPFYLAGLSMLAGSPIDLEYIIADLN